MRRSLEITPKLLALVIAALLALTALSFAVSYAELPGWAETLVAIGIASAKVTLVMLFFMELLDHRGGVRFVALTGPAFLAVLILLILGDVYFR